MKGFGMSLQGMRMGPLDPTEKKPAIISQPGKIPYKPVDMTRSIPTFLNKNRSGFSGGFKIPEEQRHARLGRKIQRKDESEDEGEKEEKHEISRDEIMAALQLDSSQVAGMGKAGAGSRAAIINDLLENMDKELEKLKRNEENIKVRKIRALTGEYHEVTEEEKKAARDKAVRDYVEGEGNTVLAATEKRIQTIRHKTGQLDSVKATSWEELERLRLEQSVKLKKLEMEYLGRTQNRQIAKAIHARYKDFNEDEAEDEEDKAEKKGKKTKSRRRHDSESKSPEKTEGKSRSKSRKDRSLKKANKGILKEKPLFGKDREKSIGDNDAGLSKRRSRSKKRGKKDKDESSSESPKADPRQTIYEAKFEKYLSNKTQKQVAEKRKEIQKPEVFDLYTKGPSSPSKNRKRFKGFVDPASPGAYDPEDLFDDDYERKKIEEAEAKKAQRSTGDPFLDLGVSP